MFGFVLFVALQVLPSSLGWGVPSYIDTSFETVQDKIVDTHNYYRSLLNASNMLEMNWSSEAATNAQRWANSCSLKHSSPDKRSISTSGCGENIYESNSPNSWASALKDWNSEGDHFLYGVGTVDGSQIGHFTQLVWYKSHKVGCGVAYCPNAKYKYFYVCQYCPAGNTQLRRPYTLGHPCYQCQHDCRNRLCTNPCELNDAYTNCGFYAKILTCKHFFIHYYCPATCRCKGKIK